MFAKGCTYWIKSTLILGVACLIFALVFHSKTAIVSMIFSVMTMIFFFFTIIFTIFFRDPDRTTGKYVVAPADGKIVEISDVDDEDIGKALKISTFMSIFNVHVNRSPINGTVKNMFHHTGSHVPAYTKSAEKNERLVTILDTSIGKVKIVQIAGLFARRIFPFVKKGDTIVKGQRIGIIKFGSRVDIYLPYGKKISKAMVKVGQKVRAGEDTIAKIHD